MSEMHNTDLYVLRHPADKLRVHFPKRHILVFLWRGHAPEIADCPDTGWHEIDALPLSDDVSYPMLVLIVPQAHAAAFEGMSVEQVDAMFARVRDLDLSAMH